MNNIVFIVFISSVSLLSPQSADRNAGLTTYEQAVTEYQNNNFDEALTLFEKLVSSGYSSFSLYFNTGNAAFKTGNIPAAILNYEKALLLKPFNEDARYNLEIAKTYTVDKLESIPDIFFIRWIKSLSLIMHTNAWSLLSLVSFGLTLILLAVFLFSVKFNIKRIAFISAVSLFLLSLVTFGLAITNKSLTVNNDEAIIFEPVVTGTSSPGTGGKELFVIHEGTKVKITDKLGEWYEIKLSDGTVGWIPVNFVKRIIP